MTLLTPDLRFALRANDLARRAAARAGQAEPDPMPVVKLFNPLGAGTWLATELWEDGDTLFGVADLGFGCPELGAFSLRELASLRLPYAVRSPRVMIKTDRTKQCSPGSWRPIASDYVHPFCLRNQSFSCPAIKLFWASVSDLEIKGKLAAFPS